MADTYRLQGTYTTSPLLGVGSALPSLSAPLDEAIQLTVKTESFYTLEDDNPLSVDLGGVTEAHVVIIKTIGGKVRARMTSTDGATQAIPVEPLLILHSLNVPVTAIDLTRETGVETQVFVFLGERG